MTLVLHVSVAALLFAMGLHAQAGQLVFLWRRPALLARSLLAMYVVVPLLAIAMGRVFELPRGTETALVVLAVCAGAPLLPRKLLKLGGDPAYVLSLAVTTSLLAIVTVPLSLRALSGYLPFDPALTPAPVAWAILKSFLVPFGAGMLVRAFMPRIAQRAAEPLLKAASAVLGITTVVMLVAGWRLVAGVGLPSFIAFAGFVAGCLATGHVLGGPVAENRSALAVTCATRHVGLALLVGASVRGPAALSLVAGYLVATALVCIPYIRWQRKLHSA